MFLRFAAGPGRQLNINTSPLQAQAINTSETPEDFQQEFGQIYSRTDFSGGSGLDKAHQRNAGQFDFQKYWDSKGVDVFSGKDVGNEYKVSLLHDTDELSSTTETNLYMQELSGSIFFADGDVLKRIDSPLDASPTVTSETAPSAGNDITGMAVLGTRLYLVANGNVYVRTGASTYSTHNNHKTYSKIWSMKGRIVASDTSGDLFEIPDGSTPSTMKTLPTGSEWTDLTDGGAVVLACATDGYIYSFADESSILH